MSRKMISLFLCLVLCFGISVQGYAGGLPDGVIDNTFPEVTPNEQQELLRGASTLTVGKIYTIRTASF